MHAVIELFLELDEHLSAIIESYGMWTYFILFLVIFCETGLVVTPFLPGDSLLFAAGAFAAQGSLEVGSLFLILTLAAVLGDTVNYQIGNFLGSRIFEKKKIPFLKREHLDRTHKFYEKHGGKTIILARFLPIIRTFAPFVAGIGTMTYSHFLTYNVVGGVVWIALFTFGGFFFGNIPFVKENFEVVILTIIVISVLPGVWEVVRHRLRAAKPAPD